MKVVLILSLGFILHMDADVAHNHAGHHAHDVEAVESDNDAHGELFLQNVLSRSDQVNPTPFS